MDDEDEFFDTSSLMSAYSTLPGYRRRSNVRDYISLSRNTVYHSAVDLSMEMNKLGGKTVVDV